MKELTFSIENSLFPKELIEKDFVPLIEEHTRKYLYAKVSEYNGNIRSYETISRSFPSAFSALYDSEKEEKVFHDIQNDLGELNKKYETYELFIGSRFYKNYKYRVLFVRYGQSGYPATVVLAEALAREVQIPSTLEKSYIYRIDSMNSMRILIQKVLDSEALYSVLQEAVNSSMIEEQRERKQQQEDATLIKSLTK